MTRDRDPIEDKRSKIDQPRREAQDDRAWSRNPKPEPDLDPDTVPASPQQPPGDDLAKPPSPYPTGLER